MKKIIILLLVVLGYSLESISQTVSKPQPSAIGIGYKRLLADSALFFPAQSGVPSGLSSLKTNNVNRRPSILADTTNKKFYWFNPKDSLWYRLINDTELTSYVPYTDTAAILNGYQRKNFALLLQDTAAAFSARPLNNRFLDSIATIRALANSKGAGTGTVTSIATNNGSGITGGTITTSGTLFLDTTLVSTRAWRQKGVDSLNGLINARVKYTDTSTMLNPYLRKGDTSSMLSSYVPAFRQINTNAPLFGGGDLTINRTISADTGRAVSQLVTGGSLTAVKDTLVALIASSGGGTVLDVSTTDGYGIVSSVADPTSTPNISLRVDTFAISTRDWRNKGVDSAISVIPLRITDSLANVNRIKAGTSGGGIVQTNTGATAFSWGGGGSQQVDFHGFAGYDANRASSYTARSFTDKNYVDSLITPYNTVSKANRPVFIDQFVNNFYGRGMLTEETINIITEQLIGSSYAAGVDVIRVADTSKFKVGGLATIKHTNGLYETYFISQKGGDGVSGTLALKPSLKYPVTSSSLIERTWFNRAHPGKFYMRQLAQQIANGTEINTAIPTGNRLLYTNFSDTPALSKDTLIALGGSTINYFAASNTGIDSASPIRFIIGNTPYVSIATAGDGAETPLFYIDRPSQAIASVALMSSNNLNAYRIVIVNDSGRAVATFKIPTSESKNVFKIYKFPFFTSFSNKIKVKIIADTVTSSANLSIGQIDVFEQSAVNKKVIAKQNAVIVGLGDSWMQGDLGNTPEREPITQQLAIELPYATIINAGFGGNTIRDMLNRFDTDVAPYNPDYVILETGTNDAYNPLSTVFYPTGVDDWINVYNQLIYKVLAIGAKPIIIGVPGLAQTDADVPTWPEWLLNDRARLYAQKFYRFLSKQTSEGGDYEWKLNVSDTAAMLSPYLRGIVSTANGGTGKSTWTTGSIPFIGSGTAKPFVEVNNSLFYDSTNKALSIGNNGRIYDEHLSIGAFSKPKITFLQTGGFRWSTYVDSIDAKFRIRYEEGAIEPLIIDRLGNVTLMNTLNGTSAAFSSSVTASSFVRSGGTSSQFLKADGSVDANTYLTSLSNLTAGSGLIGTAYNGSAAQTFRVDTGRAATQIVTGGSLNKVRDSVVSLISASTGAVTSIAGTTNQISVSSSTGEVTVSLPSSVTITGAMTASGFIVSSDKRLKNIVSRSGDMVTYTLKADKNKTPHYGYIAQEVEKVLPTTVSTDNDGIKAVNYIEVLVKKVNDLEKKIEQLEKLLNK